MTIFASVLCTDGVIILICHGVLLANWGMLPYSMTVHVYVVLYSCLCVMLILYVHVDISLLQ